MTSAIPRNFDLIDNGDGTFTMPSVPVFAECERWGMRFDAKWLDAAVKESTASDGGGHLIPMHVQHTRTAGEPGADKIPAGMFRVKGRADITVRGAKKPGVVADLIFTNPDVVADVKAGKIPWRSVELPPDGSPAFRGLALLDRDAPFHEMPMTTVRDVVSAGTRGFQSVAVPAETGGPVLAFAASATALHALIDEEARMAEPTTPAPEAPAPEKIRIPAVAVKVPEAAPAKFEADKEPAAEAPKAEEKPAAESKPKALLEAVRSAKMTIEEVAEFKAGLVAILETVDGGAPAEGAEPAKSEDKPNQRKVSDLGMNADVALKFESRVLALEKRLESEAAARKQEAEVDAAIEALADRGYTKADRERLMKFAAGGMLADHVAEVKRTVPPRTSRFADVVDAGAAPAALPEAVLKFQAGGPGKYEAAVKQYQTWKAASDAGVTSLTLDAWLDQRVANPSRMIVRGSAAQEV